MRVFWADEGGLLARVAIDGRRFARRGGPATDRVPLADSVFSFREPSTV